MEAVSERDRIARTEALRARGVERYAAGDLQAAAALWREALQLGPEDIQAQAYVAWAESRLAIEGASSNGPRSVSSLPASVFSADTVDPIGEVGGELPEASPESTLSWYPAQQGGRGAGDGAFDGVDAPVRRFLAHTPTRPNLAPLDDVPVLSDEQLAQLVAWHRNAGLATMPPSAVYVPSPVPDQALEIPALPPVPAPPAPLSPTTMAVAAVPPPAAPPAAPPAPPARGQRAPTPPLAGSAASPPSGRARIPSFARPRQVNIDVDAEPDAAARSAATAPSAYSSSPASSPSSASSAVPRAPQPGPSPRSGPIPTPRPSRPSSPVPASTPHAGTPASRGSSADADAVPRRQAGDPSTRRVHGGYPFSERAMAARLAYDRGDLEAAVMIAEELVSAAGGLDAAVLADHAAKLGMIFERLLGKRDRMVRLGDLPRDLDPRSAFLLSRVDGSFTIDDLIDISGMERMQALRLVALMLRSGALVAS